MMKGLPLAYNKDMQEDKEAVFDAFDTMYSALMSASSSRQYLTLIKSSAVDSASARVHECNRTGGLPRSQRSAFQNRDHAVGEAVLFAISQNKELDELDLTDLRRFAREISEDVFDALSLRQTLASKTSTGGTSPKRVAEALKKAARSVEKSDG